MAKRGAEIQIPLKLTLDTGEAIQDLKEFSNETKSNISGFESAKKILDGLEKSINKAFDGESAGKFSDKILKIQQNAASAATQLLKMGDQFKGIMERQSIRDAYSSPESRQALQDEQKEIANRRRAIQAEYNKLESMSKGIKDLDYYQRMSEGARNALTQLQHLVEERSKLEQSGGKGTDEWKRISEAITTAKRSLNGYESQKKRAMDPSVIKVAKDRIADLDKEVEQLQKRTAEIKSIEDVLGSEKFDEGPTEKIQRLIAIIKAAELEIYNLERAQEGLGKKDSSAEMRRGFYLMRTIIRDMEKGLRKVSDAMTQFAKKIATAVKNMFQLHKESSKTTNTLQSGFKRALSYVLRYGFGIRSLFFLFRRLRKYAKEALDEMAKQIPAVNAQMSRAAQSLNQMKGALATAIQPLLNVIVPVLEKVAALISKIMSLIGGVFAIFTGQKAIYTATAGAVDYAASLDKTGKSAKKAKKELEGYLSPIDEINKYQSKRDDDDDKSGGGGLATPAFTYAESPIPDLSKKIASLINKLLKPLKEAWKNVGDFVKKSWKYAMDEVLKLGQSVARDFWKMWEQKATQQVFENILKAVGWIGVAVGNLAKRFREAWDENNTGFKILCAIRDIVLTITEHIKNMAKATADWADTLDFTPLLTAFQKWLESMKPVVDNIAGVFEDFYTKVILPLTKWSLEKGLPELIQVFTDFNNEVDWKGLRENLSKLWEHLEPFAERVGEGLIMFIDDITDKIAAFLNSEQFSKFLEDVSKWMDKISAEDVRSGIWDLVNAFVAIKAAVTGLSILGKIAVFIKEVAIGLEALQGVESVGAIVSTLGGIAAIISGLILTVKEFFDMWTNGWNGLSTILEALGIALVTIGVVLLAPIEGVGIAIAAAVAAAVFAISQIAIAVHDNWDSIVAWYEANIQPAVDAVKQAIADLVGAIVSWWNSDIKPVIDSVGEEVSRVYVEYIAPTVAYLKEMIANIWSLLQVYWNGHVKPMLQLIGTVVKSLWETIIKPTLTYLKEGFSKAFTFIGDVIKTAVKLIGSQINALMQVLNGIIKFVTGVFTGDWRKAWDGVKDIFKGIINGIVSIFEAGINLIISALNAIQIPVPWDWAQEVVGSSSIGFNVSKVSLPRLAEGAVIPPNKEFMAMLGDQKSGTNIETPLSTMIEAFNTALNQNGGGKTTTINFLLPDRRKIASYVIEGGRVIQTSTGKNPFDLA